jgi:hypothetical protein
MGQPIGTSMIMDVDSPQAPQAAWCPNSTLEYVVELNNLELRDLADLQLAFDVSEGLNYHGVVGATLADTWLFDVPQLSMETTHFVTVTGQLAGDLSSFTAVTANVTLQLISGTLTLPLLQDRVVHRVDGQPPSIPFTTDPNKTIRPIYGSATDGDGSGVALVEYQVNDGSWYTASGTQFWSADIELPTATTWDVSVRAQDRCGEYSEIKTVAFSDLIPPTTTLETRFLEGDAPDLEGAASDLPTGGEVISVEVRIDDETAAWQPASVGAPGAGGVQDWQFAWDSPWDGVTHTVWIRAADVAGNVSQAGPFEVYVVQGEMVGGHTELAMAHGPLWLRVALLVAAVVVEIAVSNVVPYGR